MVKTQSQMHLAVYLQKNVKKNGTRFPEWKLGCCYLSVIL